MRDFLELTKPRITVLILICTAVGYSFGCRNSFRLLTLVHVLLGTALMASGTSALNQWYEVDSDSRMRRTRQRSIPAGRIKPNHGFVFGVLLSTAGFAELWFGTNALAAALGLFNATELSVRLHAVEATVTSVHDCRRGPRRNAPRSAMRRPAGASMPGHWRGPHSAR
jgi:heme O synthase-like polyprenyltransferase